MIRIFRDFLKSESSGGIVLFFAAVLAIIIDNSPWQLFYQKLLELPLKIEFGHLSLAKPFLLWVNDGLMAVFFLLIGCELKRELLQGELSTLQKAVLPGIAALGGMLVPALIFFLINRHHPDNLVGWAIPTATDIAFSLGVLSLLGRRISLSLKIFLTALATFDDLGAIIIIAIFYTKNISLSLLAIACVLILLLVILNKLNIKRLAPYILTGIVIWFCVLKSGVHATLAGVVLAMTIPLTIAGKSTISPLKRLEHGLQKWVAFFVLPIFAFANSGISFKTLTFSALLNPLPLGIAGGLFFGKQLGVWLFSWLAVRLGMAKLPDRTTFWDVYGVSLIAGIGFTMSLFIGILSFASKEPMWLNLVRVGVITGSLLSGVCGYAVLYFANKKKLG